MPKTILGTITKRAFEKFNEETSDVFDADRWFKVWFEVAEEWAEALEADELYETARAVRNHIEEQREAIQKYLT